MTSKYARSTHVFRERESTLAGDRPLLPCNQNLKDFADECRKFQTTVAEEEKLHAPIVLNANTQESTLTTLITHACCLMRSLQGVNEITEKDELTVENVKQKIIKYNSFTRNGGEIFFGVTYLPVYIYKTKKAHLIPLFKIYDGGRARFYITQDCEVYRTMDDFFDNVNLPHCFMCTPKSGEYFKSWSEDDVPVEFFNINAKKGDGCVVRGFYSIFLALTPNEFASNAGFLLGYSCDWYMKFTNAMSLAWETAGSAYTYILTKCEEYFRSINIDNINYVARLTTELLYGATKQLWYLLREFCINTFRYLDELMSVNFFLSGILRPIMALKIVPEPIILFLSPIIPFFEGVCLFSILTRILCLILKCWKDKKCKTYKLPETEDIKTLASEPEPDTSLSSFKQKIGKTKISDTVINDNVCQNEDLDLAPCETVGKFDVVVDALVSKSGKSAKITRKGINFVEIVEKNGEKIQIGQVENAIMIQCISNGRKAICEKN